MKKWREETIAELSREGVSMFTIRALLRASATLHRLAKARCNGDYPADNGERKVEACQSCVGLWVRSVLKRAPYMTEGKGGRTYYRLECPDCRTETRVRRLCADAGLTPEFQGDPRGAVLHVKVPSGRSVAVVG